MRVMPTIFVNVLVLALAFGNACADDNNKDAVEVVDDAKADTPDSPGDEDVQLGQDDSVQPVGEWGKFFDKRDWSDDGKRRVVILHTNDLHSFVSGLGPLADYSPDAENEDGTIGGFARIASLIDRERNDPRPGSSVLVVDAGDFTFGTAYAYLARTLGLELKLMEALGFDATTFGNHEMDWGPAGTASVVEAGLTSDSKLKIVASNLVFDEEDPADDVLAALMGTKVLPHHTITMDNGIKVGIFGLLGTNALKLAPHAAPVTVASPAKAAQEVVDHLREVEKCDFIVGLSHGGVGEGDIPGEDEEIAGRLKNVDVLITGHSHTLMKEAKMYGTTLVVQAGNYGQHLGNLVMVETEDGFELESWETILVDDSIPGKPEILGIVAEAEAQLADTMFKGLGYGYNTPIATTDFDLPTVEFSESGLGDFVADAVRAVTNKYDPKGPIQVVFEANGVIRDGIKKGKTGEIRVGDLIQILPLGLGPDGELGYPMLAFYLTPAEIKLGLEVIVGVAPLIGADSFFLQVSGLKFEYDENGGLLGKVSKVWLGDEETGYEETPLDTSKTNNQLIRCAANLYIAQMLSVVGSYGIEIAIKDENGDPIENLGEAIVDMDPEKGGIQELKLWRTLIDHVKSLPAKDGELPKIPERYKGPLGRMIKK